MIFRGAFRRMTGRTQYCCGFGDQSALHHFITQKRQRSGFSAPLPLIIHPLKLAAYISSIASP